MSNHKLLAAASLAAMAATVPSAMIGGVRNETTTAPKPKASTPEALLQELHEAHNAFKETNAQALDGKASKQEVEAKLAEINETMTRVDNELAEMAKKVAAARIGSDGAGREVEDQARTDAFNDFMRNGEQDMQAPRNDLKTDPDSEGGFVVPVEWDRTIQDALVEVSNIRQVVSVIPVTGKGFKKLVNNKGTGSGWVGETDDRPETSTPTFSELEIGWGEIYAMPGATQNMLDDAIPDIEAWLAAEVQEAFALKENAAFISGDGVKKPRGLLTYVTGGANATRHPLGAVQTINSGAAAALTSNAFIDTTYSIAQKYRQGASWMMNRLTLAEARKLTDGQNNYLWQPTFQFGQPSLLNGYAVNEIEDMPDLAADALPIAFGDFKKGYAIFDRQGVMVLRDPYTKKPYVLFYTTKRVGGACLDPNAYKVMKIAANA